MDIVEAIDQKIGEVRTDSLDMSIGELISLHEQGELIIQPDFQRLFRWSLHQRSRLVESVLLQLPIPAIFLIERDDGRLELIDGLQRISSLIHFINPSAIKEQNLVLEGCDLVTELNGTVFDELPLTLRLKLKRTAVRTIIIKRQSSQNIRYEMFKRLNTGGTTLSNQDIRNVNARMIGPTGATFYEFLAKCSQYKPFAESIELMPSTAFETRDDEELVLRFFAAKNYLSFFKGNINDWLDDYMEGVLLGRISFNYDEEWKLFVRLFDALNETFGPYAFVKYRHGQPIGGVAPAYYEAVTCGSLDVLDNILKFGAEAARKRLATTVESDAFRKVTGPGANSLPKLRARIEIIRDAFVSLN
jgi:hypothetical protein